MKNIHILPTDKPSRLHNRNGDLGSRTAKLYIEDFIGNKHNSFHTYITSDEEIKEGDWYLNTLKDEVEKCEDIISQKNVNLSSWLKKIILTTDQDLIKDGVQAIDDEFLEWFVKNPSCEEVDIKYECTNEIDCNCGYYDLCKKQKYNIVIDMARYLKEKPKQETLVNEKCFKCGNSQYKVGRPFCTDDFCNNNFYEEPKQETLEEIAERLNLLGRELYALKLGAKWQQEQDKDKLELAEHLYTVVYKEKERMYSEEEVIDLINLRTCDLDLAYSKKPIYYLKTKKWFEKFKKK